MMGGDLVGIIYEFPAEGSDKGYLGTMLNVGLFYMGSALDIFDTKLLA